MSVPTFLNSTFRYFDRDGVVDVQTTMDDFAAEAAAASWTNPGAGLYKSPVDGDGRWFDVLLTRIAANKLEWRVRDQLGNTICTRRAQLGAALTTGIVFVGQYHAQIDFDNGAGYECLLAGILDQSPEAQSSNNRYVFGHGWRTTLDVADTNCAVSKLVMMDNASVPINYDRITRYGPVSTPDAIFTMGGTRILRPIGLWTKAAGEASYYRFHGRRYQALLVESSLPHKTRLTVPIDAGLSGTFQVAGGIPASNVRPAIRVA